MNSLRWLTASKSALASVIAIGLAMAIGWDRPYWAGISAMIVSLPYVGAAIEKGLMRIFGTLFGAAYIYAVTILFPQNQFGYCLMLSLFLIAMGYFASGKYFPYAFILSGITAAIIAVDTYLEPQNIWSVAHVRVLEICLGVVCAVSINAVIFPRSAGQALFQQIADKINDFSKLYTHAAQTYFDKRPSDTDLDALEATLIDDLAKLHPLLKQAVRDSSIVLHNSQSIENLLAGLGALFISLVTLIRASERPVLKAYQKEFKTEISSFREAVEMSFKQLEDAFRNKKAITYQALIDAYTALNKRIENCRSHGRNLDYKLEDTTQFYALVTSLGAIKDALIRLSNAATQINTPLKKNQNKTKDNYTPRKLWQFQPHRLKHGIKIAVATLFAWYFWLWTQWPGGVEAVVTTVIVTQMTTQATNRKTMLRVFGCLLGGACGALAIVLVTPYCDNYSSFAFPLYAFI